MRYSTQIKPITVLFSLPEDKVQMYCRIYPRLRESADILFTIPEIRYDQPAIIYPAAVIRTGMNQNGARRLLAFLRSPEATTVFTRAGFLVADRAPRK